MKNVTKSLKEIRGYIVDQIYWQELFPLKSKIEKCLIEGEIKDEFWNDQDQKYKYKIDVDNRDIRIFLLHLIKELDSLKDEIDEVMEKNRLLIIKTENKKEK